MSLNIIVLAKQVPDTRNVGKDAMKEDGTINRAALPAIFNPEDLNALEQALRLKDANPGSTITMLTMGLPRAAEVVREGIFRGADNGIVLTDRLLGGADTLATSYSLAQAVRKIGNYDIVLCGRQAIDGDTAQVGPQIAEKLGIPQVTYAEEILDLKDGKVTVKRRLESGVETVKAPLPCVVTVNGSAAECRPRNAKRVMQYKNAASPSEKAKLDDAKKAILENPGMGRVIRGGRSRADRHGRLPHKGESHRERSLHRQAEPVAGEQRRADRTARQGTHRQPHHRLIP